MVGSLAGFLGAASERSGVEPFPPADAFALLAPGLQRALWEMKWKDLRPIQREAILAWNGVDDTGRKPVPADLLIMAQTAGGKTEAAFLPVLSQIAAEAEGSVRALYVGPLKALINDQFERVELLCRHMDMPVHRWHGDVGADAKSSLVASPSGVLLITPESLESLLINRTPRLGAMFGGLRAVVIDELHAFLESERGLHLASLLSRLGRYVGGGVRPRRVGLSATIGDPMAAARYLCADAPETVRMIEGKGEQKELLVRVHWYGEEAGASGLRPEHGPEARDPACDPEDDPTVRAIGADLVTHMHASTNLVFANAKGRIEILADAANAVCRERGLEERFHVHHGSLSRVLREDVEREMKEPSPDTAICSSTLEMGIDIGSVRTVGQVGTPWSVASLKQRLGRSGRRDGESRRLRVYLTDDSEPESENPEKRLPLDLLQAVAVMELMLTDRWVEPPSPSRLDLSTLTQQVVSGIAETGGMRAAELHERLCVAGAFRGVSAAVFARVLRSLGTRDVVEQTASGELILGLEGERVRASREFYATFHTPREYAVRAGDAALGTLPMTVTLRAGEFLVFAGRRWAVVNVDSARLEVMVRPAPGAKAPMFSGSMGEVHARVREKMVEVLGRAGGGAGAGDRFAPGYLDTRAAARLREAGGLAREHDLARRRVVETGPGTCVLMTWTGTRIQRTIEAMLAARGIKASAWEVSVSCQAGMEDVMVALRSFAGGGEGRAEGRSAGGPRADAGNTDARGVEARSSHESIALELAKHVEPKAVRKYDELLDDAVLEESIAADRLDVAGALGVLAELVG